MIPLLTRIENELALCTDPLKAAELQAEKAAYLARIGEFEGAKNILAAIRQNYGHERGVRISIWIMLIEGLVSYFDNLSSSARDRIYRANIISTAAAIGDLGCLTGAWLAHLDFERSAYEEMVATIVKVLRDATEDDYSIWSRVGMVLGDAFLYIGERAHAQTWYANSHKNALRIGDRAAVGALMYNRAAFGLSRLRVDHYALGSTLDQEALKFIELELASAWNFQQGTSVTALTHLVDLSHARAAMMRGYFVDALAKLSSLQEDLAILEDRPNRSFVVADLIWCNMKLGRIDIALELLRKLNIDDVRALDIDDQFVAFSIIVNSMQYLPDLVDCAVYCEGLNLSRQLYESETARLRTLLFAAELNRIPIRN